MFPNPGPFNFVLYSTERCEVHVYTHSYNGVCCILKYVFFLSLCLLRSLELRVVLVSFKSD